MLSYVKMQVTGDAVEKLESTILPEMNKATHLYPLNVIIMTKVYSSIYRNIHRIEEAMRYYSFAKYQSQNSCSLKLFWFI